MPADIISTKEAAQRLNRSVVTVHRLVLAGKLEPVFRVPGPRGAMWFNTSDIEALVETAA